MGLCSQEGKAPPSGERPCLKCLAVILGVATGLSLLFYLGPRYGATIFAM